MSKFLGPRFPSYTEPPASTAVHSSMAHPHRSLPPGKQWNPHCGNRARARNLRQKAAKEAKDLRKKYGSNAVVGQEADGALLLDFPTPARAK